jgi:hypothetical protein
VILPRRWTLKFSQYHARAGIGVERLVKRVFVLMVWLFSGASKRSFGALVDVVQAAGPCGQGGAPGA